MEHKTVFRKEAIDHLKIKEGGIYVDVTLGSGGHSLSILEKLKTGTLICFDLDRKNIEAFQGKLSELGIDNVVLDDRSQIVDYSKQSTENKAQNRIKVFLVNDNFSQVDKYLQKLGIEKVDGILADLGWSSDQLENITGLSFQNQFEELDMRLSSDFGVKAKDLLNALSKKELSRMFENYADIRGFQNQKLVSSIVSFRKANLFETVEDLTKVVDQSFRGENSRKFGSKYMPRRDSRPDISAQARVFQALRIAVNNEMQNLRELLNAGWGSLNQNGTFAAITFHSGEERIVKNFFNKLVDSNSAGYTSNQYGEVYTRPSVEELTENLRARSAKLFGVRKKITEDR